MNANDALAALEKWHGQGYRISRCVCMSTGDITRYMVRLISAEYDAVEDDDRGIEGFCDTLAAAINAAIDQWEKGT